MCGKDLRPFNFIGGEGFLKVAQLLINISAKYSEIDAASVLPHPTTISRHIKDVACQIRQELIPKMKEAIAIKQCAMTCDLWTDNYRKLHYLTIISSRIQESEDKWKLKTNILLTTRFPDITKTGEHILLEMQEQLAEIDIMLPKLDTVTFVTDQGSNIRKALENYERLPCLAHCLNITLRHTLDEHFLKEEIPNVLLSIESARKIVGYMKRSGLVSKLEKTLKQDVETRWNSVFMLLSSVQSQYEEVKNILFEKNRQNMIHTYDKQLMEEIIGFLKIFKDATDDLEKDKEPSISFAVPWVHTLLNNCNIKSTDSEALAKIKRRAERFLMEKVYNELRSVHYIATFLHPLFKELLVLNSEKRHEIHENTRQMYKDIDNIKQSSNTPPSPPKKFREWRLSTSQKDEIEKYINLHVSENIDVLNWWRMHSDYLPKLTKIAKCVHCIPASSAASEINFSKAGLLITQRRSTLDPDRVNDILLIHNAC